MFSRKNRLRRDDFPQAIKAAKRRSSAHFLVVFPEGIHGYAVVVPKKIVRRSTDRHRLKRRVTEALSSLSLPDSLIVFPRFGALQVHYEDMRNELAAVINPSSKSSS